MLPANVGVGKERHPAARRNSLVAPFKDVGRRTSHQCPKDLTIMPCFYTGTAEGDARLAADEAHLALTNVTAMLCRLCARVEEIRAIDLSFFDAEIWAWWTRHKQLDAAREREAAARRE